MLQRKGWWRSPGCIWSFLAEKKTNKLHLGGEEFPYVSNSWFFLSDVHPKGFPTETLGIFPWANGSEQSLQSKWTFLLQYGHFYPPTCLARVSRQNQVPHQSWPQKMSSSTETCTYNAAERLMFFFVTCSPLLKKKKEKNLQHSTGTPPHPFFSKPIFHTTFNQSPLNSALYGKVAKATPAIKAASSIPTPTHGNWAVTPMKKHQDKDNTNMSSTPTGFWHTDAIRC